MEDVSSCKSKDALKIRWKQNVLMNNALSESRSVLFNNIVRVLDELVPRSFIPIFTSLKLGWSVLNEKSGNQVSISFLVERAVKNGWNNHLYHRSSANFASLTILIGLMNCLHTL